MRNMNERELMGRGIIYIIHLSDSAVMCDVLLSQTGTVTTLSSYNLHKHHMHTKTAET